MGSDKVKINSVLEIHPSIELRITRILFYFVI